MHTGDDEHPADDLEHGALRAVGRRRRRHRRDAELAQGGVQVAEDGVSHVLLNQKINFPPLPQIKKMRERKIYRIRYFCVPGNRV